MARRKYFFPSERRKNRRLLAMGECQLAGKPWKYPHETWKQARSSTDDSVKKWWEGIGMAVVNPRGVLRTELFSVQKLGSYPVVETKVFTMLTQLPVEQY